MSGANGDDLQASALFGFEVMLSGMLRALRQGRMKVTACLPGGRENTISLKGRHYRLEAVVPGTLGDMIEAEPEIMAKEAEAVQILTAIAGVTQQALRQNEQLRALLSPLETSVMFARRDAGNEIVSTETFKKIR